MRRSSSSAARDRPVRARPPLPVGACDSSSWVSASSRARRSVMSAIFLRSGCGIHAVGDVVGHLLGAAARGLVDGALHRRGHLVGVHVHLAGHVAGRAADRLDQGGLRPQEALLVGVEDRHERHLGQVQALAEQVDADEDVEDAHPQLAQELDAPEGVDLGVEVLHPDAVLEEVVGEVLGHPLGQGGDQDALAALGPLADLAHQVVDLAGGRLQDDLRVDQAGGPDDLLDDVALGLAELVRARAWPTGRRSGRSARRTPPSAAAGCPWRWAAGTRARRACACGSCRPRTWRRSAAR